MAGISKAEQNEVIKRRTYETLANDGKGKTADYYKKKLAELDPKPTNPQNPKLEATLEK